MSWSSRSVVLIVIILFSKIVYANEGFKVEITSEVDSNLLLKVRLTNIDTTPIRYKLGAISEIRLYPRFKDQNGNPVILNKIRFFVAGGYPPYYALLNPNEFLESKINLRKRFPTLEAELNKQALVLVWKDYISLGDAVDLEEYKLGFYIPKTSRVSFHISSEHLINKRN